MESRKPGVSQLHGIGGASAPRARGIRFSQLSVPRQALVRLCQATNYGQIHHLEIRDSDPVLNPPHIDASGHQASESDTRSIAAVSIARHRSKALRTRSGFQRQEA